ncbi:hypothetical protein ACK8GE_06945 [Micromonosporaceae bacterium DT194]|uniref:hypothetical protein n=1 Tax=Melissospora conviva TaxID=3388432 RepID=UPI003C1E237A
MLFAAAWSDPANMIEDPTPVPPDRHYDITAAIASGSAQLAPADIPDAVIGRYGPAYAPLHIAPLAGDRDAFVAELIAELLIPRRVTYLRIRDDAVPAGLRSAVTGDPDSLVLLYWTSTDDSAHPESLLDGGRPALITHKSRLVPSCVAATAGGTGGH